MVKELTKKTFFVQLFPYKTKLIGKQIFWNELLWFLKNG